MEIRVKVEMKVVEIQNENGLTIEQCEVVQDIFNANKQIKVFFCEQDFFEVQQTFIRQALKQMTTQETFGLLIV
jgi:hypothetical protein